MHPFVSGHPVVLGLVITSVVIWGALEVRQSTKRRPEAAKAAWGNPIYLRLVAAVGVAAPCPTHSSLAALRESRGDYLNSHSRRKTSSWLVSY